MFFTKLTRLIAVVVFVFGLLAVLVGLAIAQGLIGPYDAAKPYYVPSGSMIDMGIYAVLVAAALGTLAEISFAARNRSDNSN